MIIRRRYLPGLILSCLLLGAADADLRLAQASDEGIFAELLGKYVHNGQVDYGGFKHNEARLDEYLHSLEQTRTGALSRNDQLAFYINGYNAWTLKLILGGYPGVKSIKDLGGVFSSPWKKEICRIDGRLMSLDDLEHKIIRPTFRDPRVHFALNCASVSCPPLRSEPYRGDILDQQLDSAAEAFINDPERNRIEGRTLHVSRIFDWYKGDFKEGVAAFFLRYARGDLKGRLEAAGGGLKIDYLDYDWRLNGR